MLKTDILRQEENLNKNLEDANRLMAEQRYY